MSFNPSPAPRVVHNRFVKTPVITDTLQLQAYRCGQWVRMSWLDKPSRFHSMNARGNVIAFHYPRAGVRFAAYCAPDKTRRRAILANQG
jgi:hypothetical protein